MSFTTGSGSGGGVSSAGVQAIIDGNQGWAQYADGTYTSASPLVVSQGVKVTLPNDAASVIDTYLPEGTTSFYDGTTNSITPDKVGNGYSIRIDFDCYTTSNTGYGEISLDVGGSVGEILNIPVNFPRGTGSGNVRVFSRTSLLYSLDTFVTNGGVLSYESIRGNTSIYNIVYVIAKMSEGQS